MADTNLPGSNTETDPDSLDYLSDLPFEVKTVIINCLQDEESMNSLLLTNKANAAAVIQTVKDQFKRQIRKGLEGEAMNKDVCHMFGIPSPEEDENIWKLLRRRASLVKEVINSPIGFELLLASKGNTRFEKLCIIVYIYQLAFIAGYDWESELDEKNRIPFPKAICQKSLNQEKLLDIFYEATHLQCHEMLADEEPANVDKKTLSQIPKEYWNGQKKWSHKEMRNFGGSAATKTALSGAIMYEVNELKTKTPGKHKF